jgi:hypothetical protein
MRTPYLRKNDPSEAVLIPLFHAWGDIILSRYMATESADRWVEGLATRSTIQMAWSCFELSCMLALGLDPANPGHKLSPRFWQNLNARLTSRNPPITTINHKQPPWDDWHLVQEERHPFAHLGAGGGRFPTRADATLALEEAEKAIKRIFTLLGVAHPRWLTATLAWPIDFDPIQSAFGSGSGMGADGIVVHKDADASDPATIHIAIVKLDGTERCDDFPPGYDWRSRVENTLENLGAPIKGIRVYDGLKVYLDEPLLMWGGEI